MGKSYWKQARDAQGRFTSRFVLEDVFPDLRTGPVSGDDLVDDLPDLDPIGDNPDSGGPTESAEIEYLVAGASGSAPNLDRINFPVEMNSRKRTRNVVAPVAMTSSVNYDTANRTINLSGREFWSDIVVAGTQNTTTTFQAQTRLLRPTDSALFSWLAGIAAKFEEFKFHKLRFVYEPQVSTAESGQVGIFFDGDPTHIAPANWNNFINTGANAHGAVWAKHALSVPPWLFSSRKSYYTTNEFPDANGVSSFFAPKPTDPLEYFPGIYGWCAEGVALPNGVTTKTLGKLYLEYNISLKTQNVDGFNITNAAGQQISTEDVVNSGQGWYWRRSVNAVLAGQTHYWFGQDTPATLAQAGYTKTEAGTRYFKDVNIAGTVYKQAPSEVVLLLVVHAKAAQAANKPTVTVAYQANVNTPPDWANLVVAGAFVEAVPAQTLTGTEWSYVGFIKIPQNAFVRITTPDGEDATLVQTFWAPYPYTLINGTSY